MLPLHQESALPHARLEGDFWHMRPVSFVTSWPACAPWRGAEPGFHRGIPSARGPAWACRPRSGSHPQPPARSGCRRSRTPRVRRDGCGRRCDKRPARRSGSWRSPGRHRSSTARLRQPRPCHGPWPPPRPRTRLPMRGTGRATHGNPAFPGARRIRERSR